MSLTDHAPEIELGDAELIALVRGGDIDAYGVLFGRHRDAATRLARTLLAGSDADDLVAEAFSRVLETLRRGGGPDLAFRAYLLTVVRRCHIDRARALQRTMPTDDLATLDSGEPFSDTAVAGFESTAAARAFASLPERWQAVLWHLEVEGQKPAEIAVLLGMSPNSVSALAYRAREGLRQAFVQMHAADAADDTCRATRERLGAYVRHGLSKRDEVAVREHLDGCRACTGLYLELTEVNSSLAGLLAPVVLGSAATAYLASTGTAGVGVGLLAFLGRARDAVVAQGPVAVSGAVAGVAAVVTLSALVVHHQLAHDDASRTRPMADAGAPASTPSSQPDASKPSSSQRTPSTSTKHAHHQTRGGAAPPTTGSATSGPAAPVTTPGRHRTGSSHHAGTPVVHPTHPGSPSSSPTPSGIPLAIHASASGHGQATISVSGLSGKDRAVVTIDLGRGLGLWSVSGCSSHGTSTFVCQVSASSTSITVAYLGATHARYSAHVAPTAGETDSTSGDNDVSGEL